MLHYFTAKKWHKNIYCTDTHTFLVRRVVHRRSPGQVSLKKYFWWKLYEQSVFTLFLAIMMKTQYFWTSRTYFLYKQCLWAFGLCTLNYFALLFRLAKILWLISPFGRQFAILGRQLDFRGSISPFKIKISKVRTTNLYFGSYFHFSPI